MFGGIYSAASAVHSAEVQQEAIAQNLSHLNMPGYRRVVNTFSTANANVADGGSGSAGGTGSRGRLSVDFTQGPIQLTQRSLDVAIDGDGFLAIDTPQGRAYTRDGVMQINPEGRLVNSAGYAFTGAGRLPNDVAPGDINISSDGYIWAKDQQIGRLEVVQFENNQSLKPIGPTVFMEGSERPQPAEAKLQQGAREMANVSATDALVKMMIGMRHHEAAQRAMHSMSNAIRDHISGDK